MTKDKIVIPIPETSYDPESAVEIGVQWGVMNYELKAMWAGQRVPDLTEPQWKQLKTLKENYGVSYPVTSPGIFMGKPEVIEKHLKERAPKSIEFTVDMGARYMVIFTCVKDENVEEAVVIEALAKLMEQTDKADLTVVIEPMFGYYGDSGVALSRIIRAVGSPNLKVNWDAGNIAWSGYNPFPDEFTPVKDLIGHVHLKNYSKASKNWALFDKGDIDLFANLKALKADGYSGYLALETHTRWFPNSRPFAESKHNLDVLHQWLAKL